MSLPVSAALYDAAGTRALEHYAIETLGIAGYTLMERAGAAVFEALRRHWPRARRPLIVCGAGNNGGDGYVVARLAHAAGFAPRVVMLTDESRLRGDGALAFRHMRDAGLAPCSGDDWFEDADVVVDAVLGTGLQRQVEGAYADAIVRINASGLPVLSVDLPSGIDADNGRCHGVAVRASVTVSLVSLKQGLVTGAAPDHCGVLEWHSIDLPAAAFAAVPASAGAITCAGLRALFAPRPRTAHKGQHGHVLVIGGAPGYGGAARMAAEAAARVGAGLVSLATHPEHAASLSAQRPEIMCRGVSSACDLAPLLARATVVAIGPGLGQDPWAQRLWAAVRDCPQPQVVDADGLNLLAADPDQRTMRVLTPHPGEAARLAGVDNESINNDRYGAAARLAARYGGVVLLKGAGTVIAAAGEQPLVVRDGNPGMASGGMGDVLTGVIAGLLAQGMTPHAAAAAGACVHAFAADLAARDGERGLLAADLMPWLRAAVNPQHP
ncbi:MAG: NAD(P)H-hydrate dehydratase [Gammaproteobacteria bacterium]|nr:NAD(P)H-hydrate dehydratase [Gammaproteobacteria bacterium]